jgi:hypothetical protein
MSDKPTREQVLAEPAGRQMDAWVAEFVFKMEKTVYGIGKSSETCFENEEYLWRSWEVPEFSVDIEPAWMVVEKMHESGWSVEIKQLAPGESLLTNDKVPQKIECRVYVHFFKIGHYYNSQSDALGDILPDAICRAALLAVLEAQS